METDTGKGQEAGSSSQASGVDLSGITRGAWKGSDVTQHEIDWLYRSRRIPEGVSCHLPGDEIEPVLEPGTFFYVKNTGAPDLINLPAFNPAPPAKVNWGFFPGTNHIETNRVVRFMEKLMKETNICSDDIIRTFISRRVLPLKRRAHKISEMYGPGDPTKITGLPLSKEDVVLKARQICQTAMPLDWEWGFLPLSSTNPPTDEAKQRFPRIKRISEALAGNGLWTRWTLTLIFIGPTSRWAAPTPRAPVHEHVAPLQAEVGREFLEKLTSQGKKNKAPAPDAGSSQAPPAKRSRTEVLGGKEVGKRRYKGKMMPVSSGPALKLSKGATGTKPESSEGTARTSPPPHSIPVPSGTGNPSASPLGGTPSAGRAAPTPSDHHAEEDHVSPPEAQDTGASNIGADSKAAGRAEPQVPPVLKRKKKKTSHSSPSKPVPDSSAPASSTPGQDAPDAHSSPKTSPAPPPEAPTAKPTGAVPTPPPSQGPSAAKPTPPPEGSKLRVSEPFKGKATASGTSAAGPQSLVLHVGPAAAVAGEKATGLLGRITELKREGRELGHLLDYAEKWNQADVSAATRGLGKDRLPSIDPAGPRCTEEHFMWLRRAVKEFDNAWHDATNNVVSMADARKRLFEELLWEHRDLSEVHSKCQGEKEQLIREHREALDAQELVSRGLKDQLIQLGLKHNEEMKAAKAAAEARLNDALEDANNSTVVLRAELEEEGKARKAAEDRAALLEVEQKEYDQLVMQTDALAFRLFPDSQPHAQKKVAERRVQQEFKNPDAPWDPYDHLVALSARGGPEPRGSVRRGDPSLQARAGADAALRVACSWYEDLDLDALHGVRENAPTDTDPVLTAKRQDRAYRIAEYASVRTFIPPPSDVKDYLSDDEEGEDEEDEDAGEGDAVPEAPEAGSAPPEAPAA
ncbi:hypothetical protein QYE76_015388 [Lolium multiflorum]|uniref:Uncharacterized protein n=1 Tax=Lolium multiflorum TaxID=4521 RepID=A0AAD8U2G5_LOLMU|nr:hypothetical protein QYE76_015388 [Lolium multiflorum]